MKLRTTIWIAAGIASLSMGCKGSPASPFNQLQEQPIMVYRLQNNQQPVATTTPGTATTPSLIPGLPGLPIPPEFQPQVQQAQSMICQMLPPGVPGCPTAGSPTTQPVITPATPMFEGYAILGQSQVMDPKMREEIIDIFGYEKSFSSRKSPCMYPEFGMAFGSGQTANLLISYSCNQVQPRNFQWPHGDTGMTDKTVKNLNSIIQRLFGGG
ncbi:MAG TPA: hypothetical protein PLJ27_22665 [Polyangiaceae bacterium]|jgi:hypothetical protein|nr:MAG: hypothetical protein BWY17_04584 [Deltaproteobacteria bacterium ADurb.Bin207]HNS99484.1 hypothetical protein [Polyangiaceae bacterium]HNZ24083.1 hypothetical protein [Polyangiaceae bacterium]HOD21874.1 hypothetical protein [Polyangiaceae bacterium]HOE50956.1 hypothetical protein [Polyangiaceae bacterium]